MPIYMYHRVYSQKTRHTFSGYSDAGIVLPVEKFIAQIRKIKQKYTVLSLHELASLLRDQESVPKNSCVLTVDDGFHDAHDVILPVLREAQITATFFITGNFLAGTNQVRWLDLYYYLLDNVTSDDIDRIIKKIYLGLPSEDSAHIAFKKILRRSKSKEQRRLLSEFAREAGVVPDVKALNQGLYLSTENIVEMLDCGMSFGAHGMMHQELANLDAEEQHFEISESLRVIKRISGLSNPPFAYPFGGTSSYSPKTVSIVAACGAICGCTSIPQMNTTSTPLLELRRIPAETLNV